MRMMLEFSSDDIATSIPYEIVCMTRESGVWNTTRRRRLFSQEFSREEQKECSRLFQQAHTWLLVKGLPDSVTMAPKTYELWQKLGSFCSSL